jgi:hypothetical protein
MTKRTCGHCGRDLKATRKTARFCSARCRVAAHRRKPTIGPTSTMAMGIDPSNPAPASIDPDEFDARRVLAQIAGDLAAPPSARVAACKALLADAQQKAPSALKEKELDVMNARAIEMLTDRRRLN